MTPITITVPAATNGNGVKNYNTAGRYFLLKATGGEVLVQTDTGQTYDFENPGEGFGDENSPVFRRLTFLNPGGEAINVTFYASKVPIRTPDASVNNSITATATLTNTLVNCAVETDAQTQVTYNGNPVALAAGGTYFRRAIIIAQKSLDRAANTGNIYLGIGAAHQPITLAPGAVWTLEADAGGKRDFGNWYISGDNNGDGVSVIYV